MKLTTADCERIAERMFCEAADNVRSFEPETVDYEWLFEKHCAAVLGVVSECEYMEAYNSKPVQETMDEIKTFVRDYWEVQWTYQNSTMRYYGLKQSDFI